MYSEIQDALKVAGQDDRVVVAVLTGAGDYYCSGNDLSNFTQIPPEGPQKLAAEAKGILRWVSWIRRAQEDDASLITMYLYEECSLN